MSGRDSGLEAAWYSGASWLWLLRPVEALFRIASGLRRSLYRAGMLKAYRPPVPVLVVGNITVGGTGKTPVVIALVEALAARGLRPGVVSRGYGGDADNYPHVLTANSTAQQCGDEPLLIYRRTGVPCVVDPNRPRAVKRLLRTFPIDLVISDDGLQHYALQRDMEIAVVDAGRRFGNGFCLPAGPLREPVSRLGTVDFVLHRGSDDAGQGVSYQPASWINLVTGQSREVDCFGAREDIIAMAGIGQPQQFFAMLDALGLRYEARTFADHHQYSRADFQDCADRTILMTEKDAVKCEALAGPDAWYLRIDALLPPTLVEAAANLASADRSTR